MVSPIQSGLKLNPLSANALEAVFAQSVSDACNAEQKPEPGHKYHRPLTIPADAEGPGSMQELEACGRDAYDKLTTDESLIANLDSEDKKFIDGITRQVQKINRMALSEGERHDLVDKLCRDNADKLDDILHRTVHSYWSHQR